MAKLSKEEKDSIDDAMIEFQTDMTNAFCECDTLAGVEYMRQSMINLVESEAKEAIAKRKPRKEGKK